MSNVILVEDDKGFGESLKELLLLRNIDVLLFDSAKKVLEEIKYNQPEIIISDIMMPEMDGLTLLDRIRSKKQYDHISIIIITARKIEKDYSSSLKKGSDYFLNKPFDNEVFINLINNIIERKRGQIKKIIQTPDHEYHKDKDISFLEEVKNQVQKHSGDSDFGLEKMANLLNLSPSAVQKKIKRVTGQNYSEFINNFKLERAAHLIKQNSNTISEISSMVGYNSLSYFSKCFKDKYRVSPKKFSQKN